MLKEEPKERKVEVCKDRERERERERERVKGRSECASYNLS
jgi:hypothetical protein